jgi:3-hydroxyisobutyrate dehydrogenase-like beta-hydroxyacid dehydrogenase
MSDKELAIIGLGRMGGGLAMRALEKGCESSDILKTEHPQRSTKPD